MSESTAGTKTATRPDLSHLDREMRIRIALAVTQGATWEHVGGVYWRLCMDGPWGPNHWVHHFTDDGETQPLCLPDYLHDPAAWGPVLVAEFCKWESDERGHRVLWWYDGSETVREGGPWMPTLPEAVCAGLLVKHGVEVPT